MAPLLARRRKEAQGRSREPRRTGFLQKLIWIDVHRDVHVVGKCQLFDGRSDVLTEATDRLRSKKDLVSIMSLGPFDRGRHHWMQGHTGIQLFAYPPVDGFCRKLCAPLVFRTDMDHKQMEKRRVFTPLPKLDFLLPKPPEIMVSSELDGGTKWGRTLDIDFSGHVASTRTTGYLGQELKRPFAGSKIWHVQSDIGIDDAHQSHVWEIEPLSDHLCPDQNSDFARPKRLQNLAIGIFSRHRISVHSCHCGRWKNLLDRTFDFLGSVSCKSDRGVGAFRTFGWCQRDMAAQMALEPIFTQMERKGDAAIRTFAHVAALIANQ
jgi:hypothetical protein